MKARSRQHASRLFLLASALYACSEEEPAGNPGGSGLPGADAGQEDAGAATDAGLDAAGGGSSDGGGETGCDLGEQQLNIQIDARGSHTWDAIQTGNTLHLAYEVSACAGTPFAQAQRIEYLKFKSTGDFPAPVVIANGDEGTCFWSRTPTLGAKGEDVSVYYSTTASGTNELWQKQLGSELDASRITTDPDSVTDQEVHTSVAAFGAADLIAYVNALPLGPRLPDACEVVTRRAGTEETVIVSEEAGFSVTGLELQAFAADSSLGGVLGYIASVGADAAMKLQMLDKSGKASGNPIELSDKVSPFSNVAVAMLPEGASVDHAGAVVYGVGNDLLGELRFRTIGHDGTVGSERKVTSGNRNIQGVGITPFGAGYALAFRLIDGADTAMMVKFLNLTGDSGAGAELRMGTAKTSGTAPRIFVTNDGRISLVFADQDGEGMFLRVLRGTCDP